MKLVFGVDEVSAGGVDSTVISVWTQHGVVRPLKVKESWTSRWFGWLWRWWYAAKVPGGK